MSSITISYEYHPVVSAKYLSKRDLILSLKVGAMNVIYSWVPITLEWHVNVTAGDEILSVSEAESLDGLQTVGREVLSEITAQHQLNRFKKASLIVEWCVQAGAAHTLLVDLNNGNFDKAIDADEWVTGIINTFIGKDADYMLKAAFAYTGISPEEIGIDPTGH